MSEYIITDEGMGFDLEDALAQGGFIKQRIVRCRDCKWYGHDEEKYSGLGCFRAGFGSPIGEMPNGFCYWGVPEE